jgi:hypothetical protein
MKGSLIAAGEFDENGNFIDNGELSLSTGTLTYSSLSSTMSSSSKSESEGSSYVFANGVGTDEIKNTMTALEEDVSKVTNKAKDTMKGVGNTIKSAWNTIGDIDNAKTTYNIGKETYKKGKETYDMAKNIPDNIQNNLGMKKDSDIWNYSMGMEYSSEKTLSTIGQGTVTIRDKENSDDINTLNRDINSINNLLYSGSIGLDVESVTMVGLSSTIGDLVTTGYNLPSLFNDVDDMGQILNNLHGAESALEFTNTIGYFIQNMETLKNIPEAIKNGDVKQVKNIFSNINDKNNGHATIIPVPTWITVINKGDNALGGAESIINNFSGDKINIMDLYHDGKTTIDNINDIIDINKQR